MARRSLEEALPDICRHQLVLRIVRCKHHSEAVDAAEGRTFIHGCATLFADKERADYAVMFRALVLRPFPMYFFGDAIDESFVLDFQRMSSKDPFRYFLKESAFPISNGSNDYWLDKPVVAIEEGEQAFREVSTANPFLLQDYAVCRRMMVEAMTRFDKRGELMLFSFVQTLLIRLDGFMEAQNQELRRFFSLRS